GAGGEGGVAAGGRRRAEAAGGDGSGIGAARCRAQASTMSWSSASRTSSWPAPPIAHRSTARDPKAGSGQTDEVNVQAFIGVAPAGAAKPAPAGTLSAVPSG